MARQAFIFFILFFLSSVQAQGQYIAEPELSLEIAPSTPIEFRLSELDPEEVYWVTIVPEGTREGEFGDWQYVKNNTEATVSYSPRSAGRYEIRLHSNNPGYVLYDRRQLVVSFESAGPGEEAGQAQLAELTGLWSNGSGDDYYFDGTSMTILTHAGAGRGPGTEMLRVVSDDSSALQVEWFFRDRQWRAVATRLEGENLTLSNGANRWALSRISSDGPEAIAAKYPGVNLTAATGAAAAPAAGEDAAQIERTAEAEKAPVEFVDPEAMRALHPEVFDALATLDGLEAAELELYTKAAEMYLVIGNKLAETTIGKGFDLSANDFSAVLTQDPAKFTRSLAVDIGSAVLIGLVADFASEVVAEAIFTRAPYADLPNHWKVPLRATLQATMKEGFGLLAAGMNPTPLALVGPVVDRINDLVEIRREARRLALTQMEGLYGVALGAEILAQLVNDYPGEKADEVAVQWWRDTRAALPDMVGFDDAAESARVAEAGYKALLAQRAGDYDAATAFIAEMEAIPSASDGGGLFALSAEGPLDLLVKVASGGDAPLVLARAFVSATTLSELVERGSAARTLALEGGPLASNAARDALEAVRQRPAVGHNTACGEIRGPLTTREIEALLVRNLITVVDYNNRAIETVPKTYNTEDMLWFPRGPSSAYYIYLCSGVEAPFVASRGENPAEDWALMRITEIRSLARAPMGAGSVDYYASTRAPQPHQVANQPGCITYAGAFVDVGKVEWSGVCRDGFPIGSGYFDWWSGTNSWGNSNLEWRTHVGPEVWTANIGGDVVVSIDQSSVWFELSDCTPGDTALVRTELPDDFPAHGLMNAGLQGGLRTGAEAFASANCNGASLGGMGIYRGARSTEPVIGYTESWERSRLAGQIRTQLREEGGRIQAAARQAEQERRVESLRRIYEGEVDALESQANEFLETGIATLDILAMALDMDEIRTLARVEDGVSITFEPIENIQTVEYDGERVYRVAHPVLSPRWLARQRMQRQLAQINWSGWFDMTSNVSPRQITVICKFRQISDIPRERKQVSAKLVSFSASGSGVTIDLDCR